MNRQPEQPAREGDMPTLTPRQKRILRAIVESYITTAEPVGSKTIAAMEGMDFSSATIRNEMAALTEFGLLEQPHTSAGRVPSPRGYRLYVDELMSDYRISNEEALSLSSAMELRIREFDQVFSQVSRLVSQLTDLPAYATLTRSGTATVKRFDLILAGEGSFILVVMTNTDSVRNKLIRLPVSVTEQDLRVLSAVLNTSLTDLPAEAFTPELMEKLRRASGSAEPLVGVVVDFAAQVLAEQQQSDVYLTGQTRLLAQPEYRDVARAQQVLSSLDEETISNLPVPAEGQSCQILVGPEHVSEALRDTSVVMTKFDIGDGMQGMIGVVGPTRMDYARVTARLSYFAEGLGRMFGKNEQLPPGPDPAPGPSESEADR